MTDISLIIDVKGADAVKQAAQDFIAAGTASKTLASKFDELAAKNIRVWKESKRLASIKKQLRKEIKAGNLESKVAVGMYREEIRLTKLRTLTDKTRIDQAKKAQRVRDAEVKKVVQLRNKYKPLTVAAEQYRKVQAEIKQAMKDGVITANEYKVALDRVAKEFNEFTQGVATGGNQFARFNVETYKAQQRTKRFASVGLQQVGYQVGDFAVQLQGGANMAVAFGQQMSQLLGIFGAAGAIAGAGVAIATAFIAPLIQSRKAAKEAAEGIKRNFGELPQFFSDLGVSIYDSFDDAFTRVERRYGKLIANLAEDRVRGIEGLADELVGVAQESVETRWLKSMMQYAGDFISNTKGGSWDSENMQSLLESLVKGGGRSVGLINPDLVATLLETSKAEEAFENLKTQNIELDKQAVLLKPIIDSYKKQVKEVNTLKEATLVISETYAEIKAVSEAAAQAFRAKAAAAGVDAEIIKQENDRKEQQKDIIEKILDLDKELHKQDIERRDLGDELLATALGEKALAAQELLSGKKTLAFFKMQKDEALRKYKIQVDSKDISSDYKTQLIKIKEQELESVRLNQVKKLELKEQNDLLKEQEQRIKNINLTPAQRRSGAGYQTLGEELSMRNATGLGPVAPKKDKKSTGGKSQAEKDRENYEKYILQLKNGNRITKATAHMTKQNAAIFEQVEQAKIKYAKTGVDFDEAEVKRLVTKQEQLKAYVKAVDDVRKRQEKLVDFMGSSFEKAMMSWVDHTKTFEEAFKQMASEIIKELYRILVVQSIVNAAKSYFGFEDGAVIQNGVKKFASGGIVSSPTMFPMASGRTGLMGEAGPEAIIPLSRGPNGKLGVQASGGGGTTINVVQNFSANGDESVRKLISKATPQITEAAKAAVLDSRKRGGNFRSTFS